MRDTPRRTAGRLSLDLQIRNVSKRRPLLATRCHAFGAKFTARSEGACLFAAACMSGRSIITGHVLLGWQLLCETSSPDGDSGCAERRSQRESSLYLVVSAGLLAILLVASRQFSWLDVSASTAAMLRVVLGRYVGQHMRGKFAPETFKKLVLIAVIAAGAEFLRHDF